MENPGSIPGLNGLGLPEACTWNRKPHCLPRLRKEPAGSAMPSIPEDSRKAETGTRERDTPPGMPVTSIPPAVPSRLIPASSPEEHRRCCSGWVPRSMVQESEMHPPAETTYRSLREPGCDRGRTTSGVWYTRISSRSIAAARREPPSGAETATRSPASTAWQYSPENVSMQSGKREPDWRTRRKDSAPAISRSSPGPGLTVSTPLSSGSWVMSIRSRN